jgi:GMP synthase (glutamine-hydrolysing)
MRILAIVHQRDAGPGVFADALAAKGVELDPWTPAEEPYPSDDLGSYGALLTFGGAMHADQEDRHPWLRDEKRLLSDALAREMPILAVCLGAQLLAEAAGAPPRRASRPEIGWFDVAVDAEGVQDPLLGPLAPSFRAFQWHSYEFPLPAGTVALARSEVCLQACRIGERAWGIQFHAEVTRTDAEAWIDDYCSDEDAVLTGIDPEALRSETRREIERWNDLGRGLCERFVEVATATYSGVT